MTCETTNIKLIIIVLDPYVLMLFNPLASDDELKLIKSINLKNYNLELRTIHTYMKGSVIQFLIK